MAITIRTGGNGSYKSAYTAYFTILPALREGRVVVTNLEGMEPLDIIEKRFNEKFPDSARLIRIFSRSENGIELWTHFFCWCPIDALIVIDECQDLFSKNVGFDMKKIKYKPLSDFLDKLPSDYEDFFNSRHLAVDVSNLKRSEIDDIGQAEYDSSGRIIYPLSFNEGFMRHRKYQWDIELLSPDYQQIDSGIKACAQEAFLHKNRDGFSLTKRKPYIYKHALTDSKPKLPKKSDPNLISLKIPIEAHLLYKSTGTGNITKSGGVNVLFKNPKFWFVMFLIVVFVGYFFYALVRFFNNDEIKNTETETVSEIQKVNQVAPLENTKTIKSDSSLRSDSNSSAVSLQHDHVYVPVTRVIAFDGITKAYLTTIHKKIEHVSKGLTRTHISLLFNVHTVDGSIFSVNEKYLKAVGVKYKVLDDCLVELEKFDGSKSIVTCGGLGTTLETDSNNQSSNFIASGRSSEMKDNSLFL